MNDQEATKATSAITIIPPATPALPEETAWRMIYMEGGALALVLAIGCYVVWRLFSKLLTKSQEQMETLLAESRAQNKILVEAQAKAIANLGEAMIRVEGAVRVSDVNNQHAIGRLTDSVQAATARLDKHEAKLEAQATNLQDHSHRIKVLESGSHRILPPVPRARRKDEPT